MSISTADTKSPPSNARRKRIPLRGRQESRLSSWGALAVTLFATALAPAAHASPIVIAASSVGDLSDFVNDTLFSPYFGGKQTTRIDFEGPWSPLPAGNNFNLGAVGSLYGSLGVLFGPGVNLMGGQPGFSYTSPTTVVGSELYPHDGPIAIQVVVPGTSVPTTVTTIGAFSGDGPTNDTVAYFYGLDGSLLGTATADASESRVFLGWTDDRGISRVVFTNGSGDDYYIDDLVLAQARVVSEPGSLAIFMSCLGLMFLQTRRTRNNNPSLFVGHTT